MSKQIYPKQIKACEECINNFKNGYKWINFIAPMQSGKTHTFLLTAMTALEENMVTSVVILCGSNELSLRNDMIRETTDDGSGDFWPAYKNFIKDDDPPNSVSERLRNKIGKNIYFSQDFKRLKRSNEQTLFILDESHYGQTQDQRVDNKLKELGLNPNGNIKNNYFISVSATPFAELINNKKENHIYKAVVKLETDEEYISINDLNISYYKSTNEFKTRLNEKLGILNEKQKGICLIRSSGKQLAVIENICNQNGFTKENDRYIELFSSNKNDINDYLEPNNDLYRDIAVIVINGKFRMGKRIKNKKHILSSFETCKTAKTDTLLQSIPGRMSGYFKHECEIIVPYEWKNSIKEYIMYMKDNRNIIPGNANNVKRTIRRNIVYAIPDKVEIPISTPFNNINDIKNFIRDFIKANDWESKNDTLTYNAMKQFKHHIDFGDLTKRSRKDHEKNKDHEKYLIHAYENGERLSDGEGNLNSCGVGRDKIKVWHKDLMNATNTIVVFIQYASIKDICALPETTGKEIWCLAEDGEEEDRAAEDRTAEVRLQDMLEVGLIS